MSAHARIGRARGVSRTRTHSVLDAPWLVLLLAVLPAPASAQVNVERLRGGEEEPGTSASVGIDLSIWTGNVELVQGGARVRVDQVGPVGRFFVVGNANAGWRGSARFISDGLVHARTVFRPGTVARPEVFAQVNYNEPRGLTLRGVGGGGLRLRLQQSPTAHVWWGTAYMFEHERLSLPDTAVHPTRTSLHRWSNYLSARLAFTPQATLVTTVYAQPRLDFADVRILGDASLGAEMSDRLSLVVTLHAYYDSHPPDGKQALDTVMRAGIEVGF